MSLHLLLGPSGSGKTHKLFEYALSEAKKHSDINYYVIVPEQFTLKTQRQLVDMSDCHGILNVDVLSFARLSFRLFEEIGFRETSGVIMDDMGKNLVIRHIAANITDELSYLSDNIKKLGYITEVKSLISEFKQYKISEKEIDKMIACCDESGKTTLSRKLNDVKRLYLQFNSYIRDKYTTTEELLDLAAKEAYKSEKLKKSVILFDGFTGFTPIQYGFIQSLLQISKDVFVTLVTDTRDEVNYSAEHELFYLTYETENKLRKIADKNSIKTEAIIFDNPVGKRYSEEKNRLIHLEKNIFREYKTPFTRHDKSTHGTELPTKVVNDEISIISTLSPSEEVMLIAEKIKKSVVFDGYRYKDIAIVTGDMDTYIPLIQRIFPKYEIPFFSDKKSPVLLNPFVEYIRALIDVITEKWSYEAVFRYLRSSLSGYETCEIDLLENFVLKYGIKGIGMWNVDWKEKYARNFSKMDESEVEIIENLRKKVVDDLYIFQNSITDDDVNGVKKPTKTVNELNALFYGILERNDIQNRLSKLAYDYSITDDTFTVERKIEFEKVYSYTIDLMDKMSELLGNEIISIFEYGELLDAGFDEIRIGLIPGVTDYVQVGDLIRSRFSDIKSLYIVGTNDGVIPTRGNSGGIISDIEKEFLLANSDDLVLSPTSRMQAYTGQLYLYMLMTKPSEELIISFSRLNLSSESIKPSYIIKNIIELFPDTSIIKDDLKDDVYSLDNLYSREIRNLSNDNPDIDTLRYFYNIPGYRDILLKIFDSKFSAGPVDGADYINNTVAKVLYSFDLNGSASSLEAYAECAYRNFLRNGLTLKEREIFDFKAKDMGNLFHEALEKYSRIICKNKLDWVNINDEDREKYISQAVSSALESGRFDVLYSSFRNKYMINRMERILRRSVNVLTKHLQAGRFNPVDAEVEFSSLDNLKAFNFELSETERMHLTGKIDRIDTFENDNNLYVKIIDYKSGNKQFNLLEIYKGLSLQLVIYLNAAMEMFSKKTDKDIIPAGVLYYHVDDPVVDISENMTNEQIEKLIMSELRLKGLVNSDKEIVKLFDSDFDKKSEIIPVKYKANDDLAKESSVASTEEFKIISDFVNMKIKEAGKEILDGRIKAYPVSAKGNDDKKCQYCPYKTSCRYESLPDDESDEFISNNREEIIEKMKEELLGANEVY